MRDTPATGTCSRDTHTGLSYTPGVFTELRDHPDTKDTQDNEDMSSDDHHVSVMKGKSRAFWIVLAGVFLTARVCDAACMRRNFKDYITDNLLLDHWFQMKNFTPTGEEVKVQHEFLSVINTICSSLLANERFYRTYPYNESMKTKLVWTYKELVNELVNHGAWDKTDTVQFCQNHTCSESYGTSFINTTQFENIYKKVCNWTGPAPECPFPQIHSGTTAAVSPTSTPHAPERQQTSSEPTNGNVSSQSIISDAENSETQGVLPLLVLSVAMNFILILLIIFIIYHYKHRSTSSGNQHDNQEHLSLHKANTTNMTQDQNNTDIQIYRTIQDTV
ncbi:uncharacterized protein LOC128604406 isoform X3 [Ictalurus furcatus]|uniref:uncharacterized protein LOC128604406 isoform X3 n=1 Tax=Ictalurus furcatus TaxID=66913 RepID=UPI0023503E37|nr:uncharacterized protein LOC128604406 isoform X3 [Ictalurus furcatus]